MGDVHDPDMHDDEAPLRGWLQRDVPPQPDPHAGDTDTWANATPPTAEAAANAPEDLGASAQTGAAPAHTTRSSRTQRVFAAAALALAVVVGVAIGHEVWTSTNTVRVGSSFPMPRFDFPGFPGGGSSSPFRLPNLQFPTNGGSNSQGTGGPKDVSAIAKRVAPALVDVNATFNYQGSAGEGTGIVLTSDGEVLTNNHVIAGATSISVTDVGNGQTYSATVVGYDRTKDVAVLQLSGASGLTTASIGDSSSLTVGQPVLAIGNAGGVGGTPSTASGEVTGLGQSVAANDSLDGTVEHLRGMIGVSAAVQPGDSGGALADAQGDVVGMNTAGSDGAMASAASPSTPAGFAIPINTAISIAQKIEAGSSSDTIHVGPTAFLGVGLRTSSGSSGASVVHVVAGGAAAGAGIAVGDTITSIDGHAVTSPESVASILTSHAPGDSVTVAGTRADGSSFTTTVVLASGPAA